MKTFPSALTSALAAGAMSLALLGTAEAQTGGARTGANDAAPRAGADQADRGDQRGFDAGWLGLIGLAGLFGLAGKGRDAHHRTPETTTAARP